MASEILINVRPIETRVALVENGALMELMIERNRNKGLVGSIFHGEVVRVLPGMQAAFVDIGLDRAAFLYVGDVREDVGLEEEIFLFDEGDDANAPAKPAPREENAVVRTPIQDLLKEGQRLMVQVAKDPLGTKGARITTHISLPGRSVVYMPTLNHVGISRRIEDEADRERLREIVERLKPAKGGIIVRTAGEGATEDSIKADIDYLVLLSKQIYQNYEQKKEIGLIHAELDVELRAVRDLVNEDVTQVVIDSHDVYEKVLKFVAQFMPKLNKVLYYNKVRPLFDQYEVDLEVSRALERKVWLKSGGYIVIDEAEALVVVDVNTGRFVGKKDLEDTILKTNLEAVREICHQLRIRNSGGIIIIDFIDMEKEANREKVLNSLKEELAKDRARTNVLGMSSLGLVEMTRKRIRPSLLKTLCEPCSYCDGKGFIKRRQTIANEIFRELEQGGPADSFKSTTVLCHADVADWIYAEEGEMLEYIENRLKRRVIFKVEPTFHIEQYELE
ncbi:MAG: Rne/Rng family ribonuclease [Bdellovibrionia bacterium]